MVMWQRRALKKPDTGDRTKPRSRDGLFTASPTAATQPVSNGDGHATPLRSIPEVTLALARSQ